MSVKQKFNIYEKKKMYDILMILVYLWKFSMILADFQLPGSGPIMTTFTEYIESKFVYKYEYPITLQLSKMMKFNN